MDPTVSSCFTLSVWLKQLLTVDPHLAIGNVELFAGKTEHPFDVRSRGGRRDGRVEDDDLPTLGCAQCIGQTADQDAVAFHQGGLHGAGEDLVAAQQESTDQERQRPGDEESGEPSESFVEERS